MAQAELRTIQIDRQTLLFGIHIGNTRIVIESCRNLRGTDFLYFFARVHLIIMQVAHGTVALPTYIRIEAEAPIGLVDKAQLLALVEIHLILSRGTKGHEEVVLVVQQVVIRWRSNIMSHLEGQVAHRELERTVFLLVERIGQHMTIIPFMTLQTIGSVTIPEEMRIERSHRTTSQTQSDSIHEVVGKERIDRSQVEITSVFLILLGLLGMSHLNIVLHQGSHTQDNVFEALGILHTMNKTIHRRFALRKAYLSVFIPVSLIAVHGVHIVPYLRLALEQLLRRFIKGIVGESRISYHQQVLQQIIDVHFCHHIILGQNPLAIIQLRKFLLYLHILHPVHITIVRHIKVTFLYMQGAVGKHIEFSTESKILTVGWNKLQMIAEIALYINRILYIIMVEGNGCSADRRRERILQEAHIIIVDIDIGKYILENGIDDFTRLNHLSDTIALLTLDNIFLALWILAVDVLGNRLVDLHRQGQLIIIRRFLYLVQQILALAEKLTLQLFLSQIVERKG